MKKITREKLIKVLLKHTEKQDTTVFIAPYKLHGVVQFKSDLVQQAPTVNFIHIMSHKYGILYYTDIKILWRQYRKKILNNK